MDINKKRFFLAGNIHVGFKTVMFDNDNGGHSLIEIIELTADQPHERICYIKNGIVTHILSKKEANRILKIKQL